MKASSRPVRKAVLPVAGLGTRFLPFTKAVPKELLPLVDVPAVQLVVEECAASGIRDIVLVTGPGKEAVAAHFSPAAGLEGHLARKGMRSELEAIRRLSELAHISCAMQDDARGLGHAVWCAREFVGDEPFAVLLCDDLLEAEPPGLRQLLDVHEARGGGVVALFEVAPGQEHLYGIATGTALGDRRWQISSLVEKPERNRAPSRLAVMGRYILPPSIFEHIARTAPGRGGEIQLTDALVALCASEGLIGLEVLGQRYDVGDRAGYVLAVLRHALRRPELRDDVRAGVRRLLDES